MMSPNKAIPDYPFHHSLCLDGRDRKSEITGSDFCSETIPISFLAGMQLEQYVVTWEHGSCPAFVNIEVVLKESYKIKKPNPTEIHISVLVHSVTVSSLYLQTDHCKPTQILQVL